MTRFLLARAFALLAVLGIRVAALRQNMRMNGAIA